jgi:phosphoglycerate dehydrogenase-like enzyme
MPSDIKSEWWARSSRNPGRLQSESARELPNVILTPHQIGHTQESQDALPAAAIENISRILAGKLPLYVCNPEIATQWEARWASQSL